MKQKEIFNKLRSVNVNEHTETVKSGRTALTYLSWAWAFDEALKRFDSVEYEVIKFDEKPYLYDEDLGYMVFTKITIEGVTKEMWLPVMDSHNKAMKNYSYQVKTQYSVFTVPQATMFDINKSIMRCLTKNLAMFGLGLYIYAGEDLPEDEKKNEVENTQAEEVQTISLIDEINDIFKKNRRSETLRAFLRSATESAGVTRVSQLNDDQLKALKALIDASMKTIETEG